MPLKNSIIISPIISISTSSVMDKIPIVNTKKTKKKGTSFEKGNKSRRSEGYDATPI